MIPRLAGVLNVTPDSFFDGGRHLGAAVEKGLALRAEGADIVDVGGESTRPGAAPVDPAEEAARVVPVIAALAAQGVPVSVDTRRAEVAQAALDAGASVINDVNGLRAPGILELAGRYRAGVVIMHMRGEPSTMQGLVHYDDVVAELRSFLADRAAQARAAGVGDLMIDPGLGFAKTAEQNWEILRRLPELVSLGLPVYVGASRKSFIGRLLDQPDPQDRLAGSLGVALAAAAKGAAWLRVHDVAQTRGALLAFEAAGGLP